MGKLKAPTTDYTPATLPADHRLVVLGPPQGSGNYLCTDTEGEERLVEVGYKLKKTTLITRGDFAFIQLFPPSPTLGGAAGKAAEQKKKTNRLAGEIIAMISMGDMKGWKKSGEWPAGFGEPKQAEVRAEPIAQESGETGGYVSDEEDNDPEAQPA